MLSRREAVVAGAAAIALPAAVSARRDFLAEILKLERDLGPGARIGVKFLDPVSGRHGSYRGNELFPMCSTFKLLLVAQILFKADRKRERLDRKLPIPAAKEILPNSPITQTYAGGTLRIRDLCECAMTRSDNTAANLLLATVGGPTGLTDWLRSFGDTVTRLDRVETILNEATPDDPRDTTSPAAMLATLRRLTFGEVLSPESRRQLMFWMVNTKTGVEKLRKGVPEGWTVGDRTGAGGYGSNNDIGLIWPPSRAPRQPTFVTVFITGGDKDTDALKRNPVHAAIGELIVDLVQASRVV